MELQETKNTQPCLFAMELAAYEFLAEKGVQPDMAAGFSLGEVTAATAAGIFDYETGFRLVCLRGEFMQKEAEKFDTSMAAVLKLDEERVGALCSQFSHIYPVNYNCPGQITVSGLAEEMKSFSKLVKENGGRALPLKVKGAFHSPFMKEAAKAFHAALERTTIKQKQFPLYSDLTAMPYAENVPELLSEQITGPVYWEKLIRNMIADGADTFIEIGPGSTLCNMIRKIDAGVKVCGFEELIAEEGKC